MVREREYNGLPGIPMLLTLFAAELALIVCCSSPRRRQRIRSALCWQCSGCSW